MWRWIILGWLVAWPVAAENVRAVRLTARDDLALVGAYFPVETNDAPAVILLHGFGKSREEWNAYAPIFQRNGIAALAMDWRGHGDSTRRLTADGAEAVTTTKLRPQDYREMLLDLNQTFDWLIAQPGINKRRIALVASDLGANLALRYAAVNEDLAAFVLLSPGMVNHTVRADDVITKVGRRPLRLVVSAGDKYFFDSSKKLLELRKLADQSVDESELIANTGTQHGTAMLAGVTDLPATVFGWLATVLRADAP